MLTVETRGGSPFRGWYVAYRGEDEDAAWDVLEQYARMLRSSPRQGAVRLLREADVRIVRDGVPVTTRVTVVEAEVRQDGYCQVCGRPAPCVTLCEQRRRKHSEAQQTQPALGGVGNDVAGVAARRQEQRQLAGGVCRA